jgi:hypothetical protein
MGYWERRDKTDRTQKMLFVLGESKSAAVFVAICWFSFTLRRIHTQHAVPMPFPCHAVLLRV